MTTRLCKCGSCEDALGRAFELWKKMLDDDECPIFVSAVAEALGVFADGLLQKSLKEDEPTTPKTLLDAVVLHSIAELATDVIGKQIGRVHLEQKYAVRCQRVYEHTRKRHKWDV